MIYRVRVADIPVVLITLVIGLPLFVGLIKLSERHIIDLGSLPPWLFSILMLGIMLVSLVLASLIWRRLRGLISSSRGRKRI
jgi:hypothetical protein